MSIYQFVITKCFKHTKSNLYTTLGTTECTPLSLTNASILPHLLQFSLFFKNKVGLAKTQPHLIHSPTEKKLSSATPGWYI